MDVILATSSYPLHADDAAAAAGVFVRDFAEVLVEQGNGVRVLTQARAGRIDDAPGFEVHRYGWRGNRPLSTRPMARPMTSLTWAPVGISTDGIRQVTGSEEPAISGNPTLRAVSTLPAGSRIAFDFLSREWLEGTWMAKMFRWAAQATYGERFIFGFPVMPDSSRRLSDTLEKYGLALDRFRPLSEREDSSMPYGGLVLSVKST